MAASKSPLILPEGVREGDGGSTALFEPGEWKVCWRMKPKRVQVIAVSEPRPVWAEHEWQPESRPGFEDIACRAVLRALIAQGFEADMVDDAMGRAIRLWANHPSRTMEWGGFRNQLMAAFNATMAHLSQGGRLRDMPVVTAEMVFTEFGSQPFSRWLVEEYREYGAFPEPYRSLIEDLWDVEFKGEQRRIGDREGLH